MVHTQAVQLHPGDRVRLERLLSQSSTRTSLRVRAEIVLQAALGASNTAIAARCQVSRNTVALWRARYASLGLRGLADFPRSGRPPTVNQTVVVAELLGRGGGADLSTRALERRLHVSRSSVSDIERRWGIDPRRASAALPATPALSGWGRELLGVCLAPPEQVMAVTMAPARPRDSWRPAATAASLPEGLAALVRQSRALSGRVIADCPPAQPHEVCLDFLDSLVRAHPRRSIHVVFQDRTSLGHPETRSWLARHPAVCIHQPTGAPDWAEIAEVLLYGVLVCAGAPNPAGAARTITDALRDFLSAAQPSAPPLNWLSEGSSAPWTSKT